MLFSQAALNLFLQFWLAWALATVQERMKRHFHGREIFVSPITYLSFKHVMLQHDVKTALFLLPHVLLYVLLDGTQEDVEEVWRNITFSQ